MTTVVPPPSSAGSGSTTSNTTSNAVGTGAADIVVDLPVECCNVSFVDDDHGSHVVEPGTGLRRVTSALLSLPGNTSPATHHIAWSDVQLLHRLTHDADAPVVTHRGMWCGADVAVKVAARAAALASIAPSVSSSPSSSSSSSSSSDSTPDNPLLTEAAALATVQHPSVVRLFGVVTSPAPAIVMEYLRHGGLGEWMASHRPDATAIAVRQRAVLAAGVAAALDRVHQCGFVHFDVTPRAVLVMCNADGRYEAKVASMALAVLARDGGGPGTGCQGVDGVIKHSTSHSISHSASQPAHSITHSASHSPGLAATAAARSGHSVTVSRGRGLAGYVAPELVGPTTQSVTVTQAVDVWSFGVLLTALFAGELRWPGGVVVPGAAPVLPSPDIAVRVAVLLCCCVAVLLCGRGSDDDGWKRKRR